MAWRIVKLKEVISHRKGFIEIDDETEYKLVTVKLHRKGVFLRENLKGFQIRTKKQQVCKAGDFIVAEMDAKVGGYGFIPDYLDGAIVSSHYFLFEVNEEKLRPQFLEVVSQLKILQDQIKAVGSTNYAAIRPYNVLDWEIPLPPIEKQIEIENLYLAAKQKVDSLNFEYETQLTLISQLEQAILQEAVQGKLVPQGPNDEPASELLKRIKAERQKSLPAGAKRRQEKPLPPIKPEEIPFEIPSTWVWCRLGEICERIHYGFNASAKPNNTGVRLLRITDIQENKVDWNSVPGCDYSESDLENYLLNENDIVIARTGGTIGKTFLVRNIPVKALFASYLIRAIPSKAVFPQYAKYFMESPIYWRQLYVAAGGAAQPNVNGTSLSNLLFPLPPLSEQKRIVAEIEKQFAKTKQLKEHITANQQATEQLLKALLHQAFKVRKTETVG